MRIGGRAINAEKRLLYIITPLHVQQLQRVDVLVRGRGLEVLLNVRLFSHSLSLSLALSLSRARALSISPPPLSHTLSPFLSRSVARALSRSLALVLALAHAGARASHAAQVSPLLHRRTKE